MYVLRRLARHKAILGIIFVKEQHLTVNASGPSFHEAASLLPGDICALFPQTEICVAPRTIRRLANCPRANSELKCLPGATGVVSSNTEDFGIWDATTTVQDDSTVNIVFANTSRTEVKLHRAVPMGYLQLIDPSKGRHLDETAIAEIFDNTDGEPAEPPRGLIEEPSPADLFFLDESINIQTLDPLATTYR